jgi:hypothetical protein
MATSDDFSSGSLNTGLWTFVDPVGDCSYAIVNKTIQFYLPGGVGVNHNESNGTAPNISSLAPRIVQTVTNGDFDVEAKFQGSMPYSRIQALGIVAYQDANNYINWFIYSQAANVIYSYCKSVSGGTATNQSSVSRDLTNSSGNCYLRLKRVTNSWTAMISIDDRAHWISVATFNLTLNINAVGPFVGNRYPSTVSESAPAYTGTCDYFFDTSSPISPEDPESLVYIYPEYARILCIS